MELLRCTQCKGDLILSEDGLSGRCKFCGATYHFKQQKSERLISLLNQANVSRLKGDYDSAILAYQIAIKEDETDADAYWGVVLSTFGIDYVEDKNGELVPTCRRTIRHSIFDDEFYKKAIKFADEEQAKQFEQQAQKIDLLQQSIKQKINSESDFDVFVCFKSSNEDGSPTKDRTVARKIYDELEGRQIKTFFSEVTLKNRLGQDYEPIIYKALYTCKYFVLVLTDPEFLQAPWVRNEWTRFRDRANEEGLEDRTIAVFENLKEIDLPPIFRKQGVNLQKYPAGGYEIEIADAIKLKLEHQSDNFSQKEFVPFSQEQIFDIVEKKLQGSRETFKDRLDRATGYFDIGEKQKAIDILDQTIDMYPRKSQGWWVMTNFLTDYFSIDPKTVHGTELEQKLRYNFENAKRFATAKEQQTFQKKSADFFSKLENFEKVDQICASYQQDLVSLYQAKQQYSQLDNTNSKKQKTLQQNIVMADKKIAKLKKQLSNKNYYIKNLPKQNNGFVKFFKTIAVMLIMFAILYTTIQTIIDAQISAKNIVKDLIGGVILLCLGFLPYFVAHRYERGKRIKKMQGVIDQDQKLLQTLEKQRYEYQSQLMPEQNTLQNQDVGQIEKIENSIKISENRLNELAQFDYLKEYMKQKLESQNIQSEQAMSTLCQNIQELEQESDTLLENNMKKIDYQIASSPKFYNENYQKFEKKSDIYLKENQKYIDIIDNQIQKDKADFDFEQFKKQNNILYQVLYPQQNLQNDNQNVDKNTQNEHNLSENDNANQNDLENQQNNLPSEKQVDNKSDAGNKTDDDK